MPPEECFPRRGSCRGPLIAAFGFGFAGTLSPLSSFASELGVQFDVRLEASHVIDPTRQLWIGCMGVSPSGRGLLGTFKHTDVRGWGRCCVCTLWDSFIVDKPRVDSTHD
jgi:hypothetical protein